MRRDAALRGLIGFFCPAGTAFRHPAKLGRLRGVRFRLPGEGLRIIGGEYSLIFAALRALIGFFCPAGTAFRRPAKLGRLRGVRQGGADYGATPPSRPPLHPPRSTP